MKSTQILTVHGINTDGPWQENAKYVLEPHFQCEPVPYRHYRHFGALKLVLEPWVLVPGFAIVILSSWLGYLQSPALWSLLPLGISIPSSFVRRHLAEQHYLKEIEARIKGREYGAARHLIAHSLGTYWSGRAIRKHAWFKLKYVVFAGCVLKKKFEWRSPLGFPRPSETETQEQGEIGWKRTETPQVIKVRNDVQRRDWVPITATALHAVLLRDFGMAGRSGFEEESKPCPPRKRIIHEVPQPDDWCPDCKKGTPKVPLHNVSCKKYSHSNVLSKEYIAAFWLPFFWGIEPPEYSLFVDWCREMAEAERDNNSPKVLEMEGKLRDHPWAWLGCTLIEYARSQVEAYLRRHPERYGSIDDLSSLVIKGALKAFNIAREAYHDRTPGWKSRVRALRPEIAVTKAVAELFPT